MGAVHLYIHSESSLYIDSVTFVLNMHAHILICMGLVVAMATAAPQSLVEQTTTLKPHVAILKQINQLNDDGSYTYGYEAADGSFRVENRDVDGTVKGKFGYVDEFGEVKVVEYAAGRASGFNPQGDNIDVPPASNGSPNDGEFGTDQEWQSVDADEDGMPDSPLNQRQFAAPVAVAAQQQIRIQPQFQQQQQQQFDAHLNHQQVRFAQLNPAQF